MTIPSILQGKRKEKEYFTEQKPDRQFQPKNSHGLPEIPELGF